MISALALLLTVLPGQTSTSSSLIFDADSLKLWQGQDFFLTPAQGDGPTLRWGVCSADSFSRPGSRAVQGKPGRTALLHHTFRLPLNAGAIRFRAGVLGPADSKGSARIDVVLEASGRRMLPRQRRAPEGLVSAPVLLPLRGSMVQEYYWPVAAHAGEQVRIALMDLDDRPGVSLFCSGFEILSLDRFQDLQFSNQMAALTHRYHLPAPARRESRHFLALTTATDQLTREHLQHCEAIYALFFSHFRKRGLDLHEPRQRLHVAVFDSQAGMEAYVGQRLPTTVTGFYHRDINCLVVSDYGQNRAFAEARKRGQEQLRQIPATLRKQLVATSFRLQVRNARDGINVSTIMHETAHQLSFNSGLLQRDGDVPLWLAEGLACYCEAARNGAWQGLGEISDRRVDMLASHLRGGNSFMPLRSLIQDDWLRERASTEQVLLGYAQSWALFRFLIQEEPRALRAYLALIQLRRTADHRLADFGQVFGPDLGTLERRYQAYLRALAQQARNN